MIQTKTGTSASSKTALSSEIKALTKRACHHIMVTSWPPAAQSSSTPRSRPSVTMEMPSSRKRLCPWCLHVEKGFWAREESREDSHASTRRPRWPWNTYTASADVRSIVLWWTERVDSGAMGVSPGLKSSLSRACRSVEVKCWNNRSSLKSSQRGILYWLESTKSFGLHKKRAWVSVSRVWYLWHNP